MVFESDYCSAPLAVAPFLFSPISHLSFSCCANVFDVGCWHKRDDDIRVRKYVILFHVFFIQPNPRTSWRATAKLTLGLSFSTAHLNPILSMIQYDCTSGKMFKPQIFKSIFSPQHDRNSSICGFKGIVWCCGKYATINGLPAERGLTALSCLVW